MLIGEVWSKVTKNPTIAVRSHWLIRWLQIIANIIYLIVITGFTLLGLLNNYRYVPGFLVLAIPLFWVIIIFINDVLVPWLRQDSLRQQKTLSRIDRWQTWGMLAHVLSCFIIVIVGMVSSYF